MALVPMSPFFVSEKVILPDEAPTPPSFEPRDEFKRVMDKEILALSLSASDDLLSR